MNKWSGISLLIFYCLSAILILDGCNFQAAPPRVTSTVAASPKPFNTTVISLTFDDGDADNFSIEPLLKANGIHATFYIISGAVDSPGFMTWEQLRALQKDGNEIGGHTLNHVKVQGLDAETLRHQICDDRKNLLDHGLNAVSFAYPFGNYDENAKQTVKDCGYTNARAVRGESLMIPPADPYVLSGLPYIVNDTSLRKLTRYISEARKDGISWVVLIFHHVCDSCDYFSVKPGIMDKFIPWLAEQQSKGNFKVMTIGEVISSASSH